MWLLAVAPSLRQSLSAGVAGMSNDVVRISSIAVFDKCAGVVKWEEREAGCMIVGTG